MFRVSPAPITFTNIRHLDLVTGTAGPVGDLHVVEGKLSRARHRDATTIDGGGGLVMPGLWDCHVHLDQWAMSSRWVDVSAATSADEAAGLMGSALTQPDHADDPVLIGIGFRDSAWSQPPTAAVLDATTAGRPAVVLSGDVHSVWVNSAAMRHFGLGAGDGLLHEQDAFDLQTRLDAVPVDVLDTWVGAAADAAAAQGVVGIVDLTMGWTVPGWRRRFAHGFASLRVRAGVYPQFLGRVLEENLRGGQLLDGTGWLTLGPLKVISDGSLTARTAWCHRPYRATGVGDPLPGHDHGLASASMDDLVELMMRANGLGMECAIHAIGDRAVGQALDAFAETEAHGSIEHAQLVTPSDIARMAALGVRASVQPAHLVDDRDAMDNVWADRTGDAFPLASLHAAGVELALGSDAPVAPLNPWLAIESAVRRSAGPRDGWHTEQALTLSQALLSSTRGVRTLVAGAEADLVVLPVNPFEVPQDELHTVRPMFTLVNGRVSWRADVSVGSRIGEPQRGQ